MNIQRRRLQAVPKTCQKYTLMLLLLLISSIEMRKIDGTVAFLYHSSHNIARNNNNMIISKPDQNYYKHFAWTRFAISNQKEGQEEKEEESSPDFTNFNPFSSNKLGSNNNGSGINFIDNSGTIATTDTDKSSSPSAVAAPPTSSSTTTNTISLRQLQMKEIMSDLLAIASSSSDDREEKMITILKDNHDFLLEPLEDDFAVLDPDSIYKPGMVRKERYDIYRQSMEQRINQARNQPVKEVLITLSNYVLKNE